MDRLPMLEWPKLDVKRTDVISVTLPDEDKPRRYIVTDVVDHENGSYSISAIGDPDNAA